MTNTRENHPVNIDAVRALLVETGYEIVSADDASLQVRDLESGILMTLVLEENVLFNTVSCKVMKSGDITAAQLRTMLTADNGISTSAFKLYELDGDNVAVTLNNFCKLQAMGEDDRDDILSCLSFLLVDTVMARELLEK